MREIIVVSVLRKWHYLRISFAKNDRIDSGRIYQSQDKIVQKSCLL